jgi:hypothetical protein
MDKEKIQADQDNLSTFIDNNFKAFICEYCDWSYLVPKEYKLKYCPNCHQSEIQNIDQEISELPVIRLPELVLPFQLTQKRISLSVEDFTHTIPFPPSDLNTQKLYERLRAIYLPMWLVDADVQANWNAEVGYDYQVISHQAHYDDNHSGWSSREVKEGRIRWEPRLGTIKRTYHNIPAPALEEYLDLEKKLGGFDLQFCEPFHFDLIKDCLVRIPNRVTHDAWSDAKPAFQVAASEECRQATSADHIRQFSWQAEFENKNWTLLLLPLYSTFYYDDKQKPISILINGQNGKVSGIKYASMKRAQQTAAIILIVGVVLFLLSLIIAIISVFFPPTLMIGLIGIMIALIVATAATLPLLIVWWFNKNQSTSLSKQSS